MAYERLKRMAGRLTESPPKQSIEQVNWQGVNYADDPYHTPKNQVPYAQNVDFGDPIGAGSKRGGLEKLFASLGAGGIKGQHTWKHSSGEVMLVAHGTKLYEAAGGSASLTKTSQADWDAGTKSDV